jgi:hypothetical protein
MISHPSSNYAITTNVGSKQNTRTSLKAVDPSIFLSIPISTQLSYEDAQSIEQLQNAQIEQLSPTTNIAVFIIGLIPFAWATVEFWRRIAFGESFGTGKDSVIIPRPEITIGEDDNPESSRGRRTLDRGKFVQPHEMTI